MKYRLLAAAILLCGCGRDRPETVRAVAPSQSPPKAENEVVLTEEAQKEAGIVAQQVSTRSLAQTLRIPGRITLNENRTWRVGAVADGRIVRVLAVPGDPVQTGQVLARMHSHDLHESRAAYGKALTELNRLKALETFQTRLRDRARRLYEIKAGSLEQMEQTESDLRNTTAALATAQMEVARTRTHLVDVLGVPAEPLQDSGAHEEDDDRLIPVKSPGTGTLLVRNVTPGTVVEPSRDLFVISDLSNVWMIAQANEEHLAKLHPGMAVRVSINAFPGRTFKGRITRLAEALDPTTRTVQVRIEMQNPSGALKPEMYAAADVELDASGDILFVPQSSVQEINGHTALFVRTAPGRYQARPVETGRGFDGMLEIVRGVSTGDWVVSKGSFVLKSQLLKASLAEE